MRKITDKKGQAQIALVLTGIMTLIIGAFVLVMGLIMMDELYLDTGDVSGSSENEALSTVDEAGETVANATQCGFQGLTVSSITNQSDGVDLHLDNFTINGRSGLIAFTGEDDNANNSNIHVNYTYNYGGNLEKCSAANETMVGIGSFGDFVDLIVLAIIIAVIISLVVVAFAARRRAA